MRRVAGTLFCAARPTRTLDSTATGGADMTTTPTRVHASLEGHGIDPIGTVVWSPTTAQLYTAALKSGDGALAHGGPLVVDTGKFTGRSPKDKFVVDEPGSEDRIWWGEVNHPLPEDRYEPLRAKVVEHLDGAGSAVRRRCVRGSRSRPIASVCGWSRRARTTRCSRGRCSSRRPPTSPGRSPRTSSSCTRPRSRPTRRPTAPARPPSSSSTRPGARC